MGELLAQGEPVKWDGLKAKTFSWHQNLGWLEKKFVKDLILCNHFTASFNCFVEKAQHAVLDSACPCSPWVLQYLPMSTDPHLTAICVPPVTGLSKPLLLLTVFCGSVFLILNKTKSWQPLTDCVCTVGDWSCFCAQALPPELLCSHSRRETRTTADTTLCCQACNSLLGAF